MPVLVSARLANPDIERGVCSAIRKAFEGVAETWQVSVTPAQTNDTWTLSLEGPGFLQNRNLSGPAEHSPEFIFHLLKQIIEETPERA